MTTIYRCDCCKKDFRSLKECRLHEASHMSSTERTKYLIMLECMDVCDFCEYSYYVYGCERDCVHNNCNRNNNYSDFVPVNPFHNKKISGGV